MDIAHIRSKYRDRMLMFAFVASGWSPEPEGQKHGCVLAVDGKYPVSIGFNGPDREWDKKAGLSVPDCGGTCCVAPVIHAEVNALINLKMIGIEASRCVAFVTKKPCSPCDQALKNAGIKAIMWMQDVGEDRGQWVRP